MTASAANDAAHAAPPDRALSPGFYHLTLLATLLSVANLRLRPMPLLPTFSVFELIAVPTLLAVVVEMMYRPHMARRLRIVPYNRPLALYVGYAGFASIVGLVRATDSLQAFHDLFSAFALYVLVLVTVDSQARLIGLLATNLVAVVPGLLLSLVQIATGKFFLFPRSEVVDGKLDLNGDLVRNAPTGVLAHPNSLALYLMPILVFLLVGAWRGFGPERRRSAMLGGALLVTLFVLKMTYAKGAYAWLTAGVAFLVLPRIFDRWRVAIAIAVPVLGITALIWIAVDALLQGDLHYGTLIDRMELWFTSYEILVSDRFVTCFGGGGPQLLASGLVDFEYANPHNAWLSQALTYGVPAMAFYLASYVSAFRSLGRQIRTGGASVRAVALATMASLMALLGENFFEPADRGPMFQAQLFLLFALAARGGSALPADPDDREQQAEGEQAVAGQAAPDRAAPAVRRDQP